MRIIHYQPMCYGGLGDFLRASISLYALSKHMGFEYYIDFEHPFLKNCFIIHRYICINDATYLSPESLQIDAKVSEETATHFFSSLDQDKTYTFVSNHYGYIDPSPILEEYNTCVLSPSEETKQMVCEFLKRTGVNNSPYLSLHIRCGDAHLAGSTRDEKRVDMSNIGAFISEIRSFVEEHNSEEYPVVLHTDSLGLKHVLFCSLPGMLRDTQAHIQHIAEYFGNFTQETVISTVAEFYFIMGAKKILCPVSYSGFSHIAAVIGQKPYYTKPGASTQYVESFFVNI